MKLDVSASAYSGDSADGIFSAYNFDSGELLREYLYGRTGPLTIAFNWGANSIGQTQVSFNEKLSTDLSESGVKINGITVDTTPSATFSYTGFVLFTQFVQGKYWNSLIKLFAFSVPGKCRLIPALRNADGVPGMWDTVSKQFFENAGTGVFGYRVKGAPATYSLRDPHRVAPSGVWARLAADGTLDAVAETELDEEQTTAQGYAYFANTAEAAEVLGATEQEPI